MTMLLRTIRVDRCEHSITTRDLDPRARTAASGLHLVGRGGDDLAVPRKCRRVGVLAWWFSANRGQDGVMAAKRGRPSKGDRTVLWARVPTDVADTIKADATRRGMPYGDVVAEILCAHHGKVYEHTATNPDQEALDLKTA
jgi:hypothetical protein